MILLSLSLLFNLYNDIYGELLGKEIQPSVRAFTEAVTRRNASNLEIAHSGPSRVSCYLGPFSSLYEGILSQSPTASRSLTGDVITIINVFTSQSTVKGFSISHFRVAFCRTSPSLRVNSHAPHDPIHTIFIPVDLIHTLSNVHFTPYYGDENLATSLQNSNTIGRPNQTLNSFWPMPAFARSAKGRDLPAS